MRNTKALHRLLAVALTVLMAVQLFPATAFAGFTDDTGTEIQPGGDLFDDRVLVSETEYHLSDGVTEYVTYSNNKKGNDQNIDYFCEVDLSKAQIMAGYGGMDQFLSGGSFSYQMMGVSKQVESAQEFFNKSPQYSGYQIVAAINADYYNMSNGKPSGLLVINGEKHSDHNGSYYFAIDKQGKAFISNSSDISNVQQAVAGYATLLVENGEVVMPLNEGTSRNVTYTAIGIKADGTVVTFVAHGQSYPVSCGYNMQEVAKLMKARGCQIAMLLDGSGSSTYVSRHEGESGVSVRNSPSDGQERMVSDSLMIISAAASDGKFDHAVVSPDDENYDPSSVYTPGSTVTFTAIGSDRSGAPAQLPENLNWALADSKYGVIDGNSGKFVSNDGVTGEVEVILRSGADKIGSTTITIAEPDEISFAAETASMGANESSDLGIQVRYQQRNVIYKNGDLVWEITPTQYTRKQYKDTTYTYYDSVEKKNVSYTQADYAPLEHEGATKGLNNYENVVETSPDMMKWLEMGSFENNLFHCDMKYTGSNVKHPTRNVEDLERIVSTAEATVTVKSHFNASVSGAVKVEIGKEQKIAIDFETPDATILHGKTGDGANDITGVFEDGVYKKFSQAASSTDPEYSKYDMICLTYEGRTNDVNHQGAKLSIVSSDEGYPVRFGKYSAKLDYDFTDNNNTTDGACFSYNKEVQLEGNPTAIGVWVYIPEGTPNLWLRLRYRDGTGNTSQVNFTPGGSSENDMHMFADNAWHYFEADISNLATPVSIPAGQALRAMVLTYNNGAGSVGWQRKNANGVVEQVPLSENYGSLYFDNLTYVYGSSNADTVFPEVTSVTDGSSGTEFTDGMTISSGLDLLAVYEDSVTTSKVNTGISGASLYVDGQLLENGKNATVIGGGSGSTELRASTKLTQGNHILRLVVRDNYGNETVKTYNVTVDDSAAQPSPVAVAVKEDYAILGDKVHVTFTPQVEGITSLSATVLANQAYTSVDLDPFSGVEITDDAKIHPVAKTVSFTVEGNGVKGEPMATLVFDVPSTVVVGTSFTAYVSAGLAGGLSYGDNTLPSFSSGLLSAPVSAKYTLSSGAMVRDLEDTMYFLVSNTQTGEPASGVKLFKSDGTEVGTSDQNGKVDVRGKFGSETNVTVQAKGEDGSVLSGELMVTISSIVDSTDGKPMQVWRNASNGVNSVNVSWFSSPTKAGKEAFLQIAESEDGIANGKTYSGTVQLIPYYGGAVNVCGAKAEDLKSGTTYYYRVGDGTEANWSEVKSFTTGYENTGTNMLILGDLQEQENTTVSGILDYVKPDDSGYDLTIQTGDFVDNGSNYNYWKNTLAMFSTLNTPRLFSIGNHEGEGGINAAKTVYNQEDECYSVVYGNVYIASIPHQGGSRGLSGAMEWLKKDAAKHPDVTWKIMVTHGPAYYTNTAGGSDANRAIIGPAVEQAGIDIVLSGHDHSYARTEPLKDGQIDEENGITYFICGSLGEKSYAVTVNPEFHFAKTADDFNAVYLTLSTTDTELTVNAYDFTPAKEDETGAVTEASAKLIDTFTKTKEGETEHTHEFTWDGKNRLNCSCGYSISALNYIGYANYETAEKSGRVYLNNGVAKTGVFAVGEEVLHAGVDGFLHNSETVLTTTCMEDGYLCVWCHDCGKFYQASPYRRMGHIYDENHVCTREIFDMSIWGYRPCGHVGKDVATLPLQLSYNYAYYTGKERKPSITITDTLVDGSTYKLINQSTYGDFVASYSNNTEIGRATIVINTYDLANGSGNYYGSRTEHFDIVPNNVETIRVNAQTNNSVTLGWDSAVGAESYIVYQLIGDKWTRLGTVSETQYTVTGLEEGSYQFRIRPFTPVTDAQGNTENFYSTRNSDILTVEIEGGVNFADGSVLTKTYGEDKFTNAFVAEEGATVRYSSSNETIAAVEPTTGEVTIHHAGVAFITATSGDVTAQYRLNVDPMPVQIEWSGDEDRVYDGQPSSVTALAVGLIGDDTATVKVEGGDEKDANFKDGNTGSLEKYTATVVEIVNGEEGEYSDYTPADDAQTTCEYLITPATLKVLWSNDVLTYTGANIGPTATPGDGLVAGDTVQLSVRGASEPGTYIATAASINPNYVVDESTAKHRYTIVMPTVTLSVENPEDVVTYVVEGTTIVLYGTVHEGASIYVRAANGTQITVVEGGTGTIYMTIPYTVDATKLTVLPANVEITDGGLTSATGEGITNEQKKDVEQAMTGSSAQNLKAAIAGFAKSLADDETGEVEIKVSMYMEALSYTTDKEQTEYTVELHPVFTKTVNGVASETETLDNEQISAPITVALKVPSGMELDKQNTFIRHKLEDGTVEYIKPTSVADGTVTFSASKFSEFTVCTDEREVVIFFNFNESQTDPTKSGLTHTRVFGPADIGKPLTSGTDKWLIDGQVYVNLTEELLSKASELEEGEQLEARPYVESTRPGPGSGSGPSATVNSAKAVNGSFTVSDRYAKAGETVTVSPKSNEGYMVDTVTVTDYSGESVKVTQNPDGTYSFVMPKSLPVTVRVTFKQGHDCPAKRYTDIDQTAWYHEGVDYVVKNGLMNGTGITTFEPESATTRAMVVTILYRLAGEPDAEAASFTDVPANEWYSDAVAWAAANGVAGGYGDGLFGPEDPITREQMAAMLYRYASNVGKYDVAGRADLTVFSDAGDIDRYAGDAMRWAVAEGLIGGTSATTLEPQGDALRAQVATILMRFCENVVK